MGSARSFQFTRTRTFRERWFTRPWHPWHDEHVTEFNAKITGWDAEEGTIDFDTQGGSIHRYYRNRLWHQITKLAKRN